MTISPPQNGVGTTYRDTWPQYKGQDADEVIKLLEDDAINGQLFKQPPGPKVEPKRNKRAQDFNDDIWLYTDEENKVAIIPKRGVQHDSPISGLEELVGTGWVKALNTVLDQIIGVKLVYGIGNFPVTREFDRNRLIVRLDEEGKVADAPSLG